ncbi:hypothetical protein [Novosphingobium sp. NBM11]|nr:hypothetical protein [Novosphingobium sp. NBM11]
MRRPISTFAEGMQEKCAIPGLARLVRWTMEAINCRQNGYS